MENFLWQIDLSIFKFFNQTLSTPWLDQITPILTDLNQNLWFKIIVPILFIFFFVKKFKRNGISYFLFCLLAVTISDFSGGKIKKIVKRPRPYQVVETGTIQKSPAKDNRSFYSNHSSNMFTISTYLSVFFPSQKILFFAISGLIALTRVHVGVHYPSDILFGALMGIMWGLLLSYMIKKLIFHKESQVNKL